MRAVAKREKTEKDFLDVGLGASAGGVEALQDFFSTVPSNSSIVLDQNIMALRYCDDYIEFDKTAC